MSTMPSAVRVRPIVACLIALATCPAAGAAQAVEIDADGDGGADGADWTLVHRRYNTREGSSGGLSIVDPGSGVPGSLRLQLVLDAFPGDDFLRDGDEVAQSSRALSFSWTALEGFELHAAMRDRGTSTQDPAPTSLHAQGLLLGFKLYHRVAGPVTAGGGLRFDLRNGAGNQTPLLASTSVGVRGAAAFDFRDLARPLPLVSRLNVDYLFDNSAIAVEDAEDARYRALENALPRADDTRHLISRSERYAFGINRVDTLALGVGFEAPLAVAERTFVHPLLEWRMGVPINRQGYDCPVARDASSAAGSPDDQADACLGASGVSAWSMNLTAGVRVAPPVRGVSLALAFDIGLTGTSSFVHELAPNSPFMITLALGYDYDARPEVAKTSVAAEAVVPESATRASAQR